ncbi:ketoacyl-ACP synthase III family protein [Kineococcus sp. NPDC059986]|jgi:3-oxoacyl-[acyl-carrier-protein] synthase-3|uniref:ketoacyl-ACP synthase III family protein n=1 Tax=Kineococcus sp. NPDC059986 TaxID=3155538 RepID=UPI00344D1A28
MRCEDVFLAGTGRWLPPVRTVADAVADGSCTARAVAGTQMTGATVSADLAAPQMAALAVREAVARAFVDPDTVDRLLYADVYYQGHDMWAPASYVQREALGARASAVELRQMSNGGMAALELAAVELDAARRPTTVVVAAGDRFCLPGIDRWASDPGTVFGDGAAALVLSSTTGFARLRSVVTVADPGLEGMHRGLDAFGPAPFSAREPLDVKTCQRAYLSTVPVAQAVTRTASGQRRAVERALAEAGVEFGDVDWFLVPHFGRRRLDAVYLEAFGIPVERTTWSWFRSVGHLGAADQFAGLDRLAQDGSLRAGQRVLLVGAGAGFTWSAAVVEVLDEPWWSGSVPVAAH